MAFDPHPLINVPLRRWDPTSHGKNFPLHLFSRTVNTNVALTGGPLTSDLGARRFTQILDAIASACVSEAQKQVVATTLTLSKDHNQVILCVAQNDEILPNTATFLESLWKDMQKVSKLHRLTASQWSTDDVETIPTAQSHEVADEISHIYERCYEHGILKFKHRLMKRWDVFVQFRTFYKSGSGEESIRGHLDFLSRVLRDVLNLVSRDHKMTPTDIVKVQALMSAGWKHFKVLREKSDELQMWADEFTQETSIVFPLHRYLKKCYSLHGIIGTLAGFAISPRLSPVFSREFAVKYLPPEGEKLMLWDRDDEWQSYFMDVFEKADLRREGHSGGLRDVQNVARSAAELHRENPRYRAPVHCECLLLAHHHRQLYSGTAQSRAAVTPPLNYIGCSKLSCYACKQYFDAYNHASKDRDHPMHFSTRGSHSKVYPWAMPTLDDSTDARIREIMSQRLCEAYGEYLTATGQARPRVGSDSTVQSIRTVEDNIADTVASKYVVQPEEWD